MEYDSQEVTLKVSSRPLRCIYLVRDREEVLDAVALYTHMWGGAANAILPIPVDYSEVEDFQQRLELINPDYIFIPTDKLPNHIVSILNQLPTSIKKISRNYVQNYIDNNDNNFLYLGNGRLSQMSKILLKIHSNPINSGESNIRIVEQRNANNFELALQFGIISNKYKDFLVQYLGATAYKNPDCISHLIKLNLVISKYLNPVSLTMLKTKRNWNGLIPYHTVTGDEETLCLFLDDGQDIGITTVFWNCRWIFPQNKIFLPKKEFLENLEENITLITEFMPHLRAIFVTTPIERENAVSLQKSLDSMFTKKMNKKILVKVIYKDFKFDWLPGNLSSKTTSFTRIIASNGCVRFEPLIPEGHENTDFKFAYDAEVRFKSGRRFFYPYSLAGSRLLTNELWRIEYAENNKDNLAHIWLQKDLLVRSTSKGITGTALPGKESCFYIHPDHLVIIHQLKDMGFKIKLNKHTLYAQGLVKRLNGIEKVVELISDGGTDIISALSSNKENHGIDRGKILSFLIKERDMSQEEAKRIIENKLKSLLSSNLIYRGYILQCPNCNLKNWLHLRELQEFVECKGCAESFQIPIGESSQKDGLTFSYKLNELAHQLIDNGGLAVLTTASSLMRVLYPTTGFLLFGGDICEINSKTNFAEIDLFYLTEEGLIISECKSIFGKKDQRELEEKVNRIQASLEKNINFAVRANVKVIILGISSNFSLTEIPDLSTSISDSVVTAKDRGIGLHLIYNEKFYLWGKDEISKSKRIQFTDLIVPEEFLNSEWGVGESPTEYGGSVGSKGLFDQQVLKVWENYLKD
ncbi:MAG: hypothetical protein VKK42_08820 [Lyngbya sp.]|nr:hypothetical protein [Lyngbya sp.]